MDPTSPNPQPVVLSVNPLPPRPTRLFDAHNHLQDDRFAGRQDELIATAKAAGLVCMVVNGSREADWPLVAALARRHPQVLPSFGCHSWHLGERTDQWREALTEWLDRTPGAGVGEIGLDRWMLDNPVRWRALTRVVSNVDPPSLVEQEAAFLWQFQLAAERNLPASIHCLQAFGRLHELLATHPRPARGFLLHSYGGPAAMIPAFAKLGAYFSFSGYFAQDRKVRQREAFRSVPPERLLVETDAPDQLPPDSLIQHPLTEAVTGGPLNHPANLGAILQFLASFLGWPAEVLAGRVATNFERLFGRTQGPVDPRLIFDERAGGPGRQASSSTRDPQFDEPTNP